MAVNCPYLTLCSWQAITIPITLYPKRPDLQLSRLMALLAIKTWLQLAFGDVAFVSRCSPHGMGSPELNAHMPSNPTVRLPKIEHPKSPAAAS